MGRGLRTVTKAGPHYSNHSGRPTVRPAGAPPPPPQWEDVDTIEDLERLRVRLMDAPPLVAPRTRAVLRQLV